MTLKSYNGFTPAERRLGGRAISEALADGRLTYAEKCSVCERGLSAPHQFHCERYHEPLSVYPVCRRCHHASRKQYHILEVVAASGAAK